MKEITFDKPLFDQLWNSTLTKEEYLTLIHTPKYTTESIRLFNGDILDGLSKTPWFIVSFVWIPISILLILEYKGGHMLLWFIIGLITFTLFEYILHRFVFHLDKFLPDSHICFIIHFFTHGVHHFLPNDKLRLVMPPGLAALCGSPLWLLLHLTMGLSSCSAFLSGFTVGYVAYDMFHYFSHHNKLDIPYFTFMRKYHSLHHYKYGNLGFGVTSIVWDWLFGTLINDKYLN